MKYRDYMVIASLAVLAACSGNTVKNTLGLDRAPPDEFRVVSRPPLSVPPQFSLRPPSATAEAPNQLPTSKQAQDLMTGNDSGTHTIPAVNVTSKTGTSAESAFLKNAGAANADPNVREKIVEERIATQEPPAEETSWYNFWSSNPPPKEPLVNANKESQRIKTNADAGQPVTQGDTPVVKDRDTGLLGQIFGY